MNVCPSDCLFLNLNKCFFEGKISLTMVTLNSKHLSTEQRDRGSKSVVVILLFREGLKASLFGAEGWV